jgi:hypothetical protein
VSTRTSVVLMVAAAFSIGASMWSVRHPRRRSEAIAGTRRALLAVYVVVVAAVLATIVGDVVGG